MGFFDFLFGGDKGDEKKEAERGITGVGERVYEAGALSPEEEAQYKRSFESGELLEALSKYQAGLGDKPEGYLTPEAQFQQQAGPVGQAYYGQVQQEIQDPAAFYQSTLDPELKQVQDYIDRTYQKRGLLRSGLPIEEMGRAGVELAIKSARERMAHREQSMARAGQLSQYTTEQSGQNLSRMADLYGQQQGFGLNAILRQAGQAQAAGQYWAYPYQAQLGSIYGGQAAQQAGKSQAMGSLGNILGNIDWGSMLDGGDGKLAVPGQGGYGAGTPAGARDMGTYTKLPKNY